MLLAIVSDLEHIDTCPREVYSQETPAMEHGASRLGQGFTVTEMALEYQALRKSVMRLFCKKSTKLHPCVLDQLIEFNESMDRSLGEAIDSYSKLKEQQTNIFTTMLSSSPDLNYILDLNGSFLYLNKAMSALYQQPEHEIIGKAKYNESMPSAATIREHIQSILATGKECQGEIVVKKSPLSEPDCFFEYVYAPIFDHHHQIIAIAGTSRNITKQKQAEAEVWHYANYDDLTGLANRRRFRDKLDNEIKQSRRSDLSFALFFIDLDKFKTINDEFGHDGGDVFLQKTARRISACLRDTDVVARIGGDEFAVIFSDNQTIEQIRLVAEKLLSEIKKPVMVKKNSVHLTASIGIVLSPQNGNEPNGLLINADHAMYAAKQSGGDGYQFY